MNDFDLLLHELGFKRIVTSIRRSVNICNGNYSSFNTLPIDADEYMYDITISRYGTLGECYQIVPDALFCYIREGNYNSSNNISEFKIHISSRNFNIFYKRITDEYFYKQLEETMQ